MVESARLYTDLGLAEFMLAEMGDRDPAMLGQAITSCVPASRGPPARPHAWTRLAYAELLADGPSEKAAAGLEMARATAPMSLAYCSPGPSCASFPWPFLSESSKAAARAQVHQFGAAIQSTSSHSPNHRPRQLVESTMTADLEPPVKPRYAQPVDD